MIFYTIIYYVIIYKTTKIGYTHAFLPKYLKYFDFLAKGGRPARFPGVECPFGARLSYLKGLEP